MNKAILLAVKDLRVLLSDKGNIFWVFGFPVLYALFFGAIFSSAGEGPSGMKIAIADEDNSDYSNSYVAKLESNDALDIMRMSRETDTIFCQENKESFDLLIRCLRGLSEFFGDIPANCFQCRLSVKITYDVSLLNIETENLLRGSGLMMPE